MVDFDGLMEGSFVSTEASGDRWYEVLDWVENSDHEITYLFVRDLVSYELEQLRADKVLRFDTGEDD